MRRPVIAITRRGSFIAAVPALFLCIPLLLAFEIWQLVLSERYLGLAQIERDADPRSLGLGELTAFLWIVGLVLSSLWCLLMLSQPTGRAQAVCMLGVTIIGYSLRRTCGLKWVLVVLTFEGAIRVGMLLSLIGLAWRQI